MAIEQTFHWWYDSSTTIHVYNNKNLFKSYEVATTNEKVLTGNHDTTKVEGKGIVELQFTSRKKLILMNVFHLPDVKWNLISTNLLCKKGLKAIIEVDKVIISKNGVFVS